MAVKTQQSLFDFENYRDFLKHWIDGLGDESYGARGRLAKAMGVSSSLLSQVLAGDKSLTLEQASDVCDYLALNEISADYFQLLVELDRAGKRQYREKLLKKIRALKIQSQKIGRRVPRQKELTDEVRAIYYSSWIYTGVRNLVAVPQLSSVRALANRTGIDQATLQRVVSFLIEEGLVVESSQGLTYGTRSTHVDRESPFVNQHHQNWRIKAMSQMDLKRSEDVFFTSPMSLSEAAFETVKNRIPDFIEAVMKTTGPSDSETVACLNLDWFKY